jgi:hypothetical protein
MKRLRDQAGSSLITLVGVIAALAIMGATLVVLTGNVQSNTYNDRMKAKANSVTEAALDVGMYELSAKWPTALNGGPSWGTTQQTAFRNQFGTTEFPNPKSGSFSAVTYFDNAPYTSPYSASSPPNYDMNKDSRMWLTAQSGVGPTASRIQVLVEITYFDAAFPQGVALFTGANLLSNGGGNNPKIVIEVPPPSGGVSINVVGTIDDPSVADQSKISELTGAAAGTIDQVMPPSLIQGLTDTAKAHGRYFSGANAISNAENSVANGSWSDGGLTGLTVIEPTTPGTLSLKDDYNSEAKPGVILLLGGSNLDFGGGGNYWGVLYTQGTVDKGHGNFIIHGMLACVSTADMRGTVNILYNYNAISNLSTRFTSNVRIVQNTWRELKPL